MNLDPKQQAFVDSAPARWGCWGETGVGKTAIALSLAIRYECPSVLIITRKGMKKNWEKEIGIWDRAGREYLILTKEEFKASHSSIRRHDAIIFDEAHYGAYATNGIHKAFISYSKRTNPRCVWAATATPILSDLISVHGLSLILGIPLMSWMDFRHKYYKKIPMGMRSVWIQRNGMDKEIAADLHLIGTSISNPDTHAISHEVEEFPLLPEQEEEIRRLDEDPTTANAMVWANKVLQISNGTLKLPQGGHRTVPCLKLKRLLEIVKASPKLLIVCRQTAELEMLSHVIPNSRIYDGSTSEEDRAEIEKEANEGKSVMLLQAECGVGFNLPEIRTVVFYSHTWSFVSYKQSLGRNSGKRQLGANRYVHLITKGSPDASVWSCLERKKSFDAELYRAGRITS